MTMLRPLCPPSSKADFFLRPEFNRWWVTCNACQTHSTVRDAYITIRETCVYFCTVLWTCGRSSQWHTLRRIGIIQSTKRIQQRTSVLTWLMKTKLEAILESNRDINSQISSVHTSPERYNPSSRPLICSASSLE